LPSERRGEHDNRKTYQVGTFLLKYDAMKEYRQHRGEVPETLCLFLDWNTDLKETGRDDGN
jgi:hypothetical protein